MGISKQLYDLQEADREIERIEGTVAAVEARLRDEAALLESQRRLKDRVEALGKLKGEQRDQELQGEALAQKISALERKLYGGTVSSPRELSDMQKELEYLKTHKGQVEDTLLELMERVEEVEAEATVLERDAKRLEEERRVEVAKLRGELESLSVQRGLVQSQRDQLRGGIEAKSLGLYQGIKAARQGAAVAKVEQGRCSGCRMALPTHELQRARTTQEVVQCSRCGRILYVS